MRTKTFTRLVHAVAILATGMIGCSEKGPDDEHDQWTVTYIGNGNTSGTVPVDANSPYSSEATVTVLNEGDLVKTDWTFRGWNTSPDGTGTNYVGGSTFIMPSNNLTLYAQWQKPIDSSRKINRFEAVPYTGSDKIKYSYSYDGYDFYYIYLGVLKNIPMYYLDAQYFGTTAEMTYVFSIADTELKTIRNTVSSTSSETRTVTDQYTRSKTTAQKISTDISAKFKIPFLVESTARVAGEMSWNLLTSNSQTNGFQQTTSLTETEEYVSTFTYDRRQTFTWPLSKSKGDRTGWYRYTLFGASDTYLYVIKDSTGILHYEFKEYIKPDDPLGWMLDYSETLSFDKSDSTGFEFDISMLDSLPKPELALLSGIFTDSRDGQVYRTIKIGTQVWMAENLNYNVNGSVCHSNLASNCNIYGRLYNWNAARAVCPSGWHLPNNAEWLELINFVEDGNWGSGAGTKLRAVNGWNIGSNYIAGTDNFGFSALPGGDASSGIFYDIGNVGVWWSATEVDASVAWGRNMGNGSGGVTSFSTGKSSLFSVRCVRD